MSEWTNERVEKLKQLWSEGLSTSQIAAQLGGVSRNGIIGKAHRLNLPPRTRGARSPTVPRQPRTSSASSTKQTASHDVPVRLPRGGSISALVLPRVPHSRNPDSRKVKKDDATPTFTCRAVSLMDVQEGQCGQYLMPGDDGYDQGAALYCGNPIAENSRKYCAGHLERLKSSNGKGTIGRFTDSLDRGLSRLHADA